MTLLLDASDTECRRRRLLSVIVPPIAAYRYGCMAISCTAPIFMAWLAGLVCVGYALAGGPFKQSGVAWGLMFLGGLLWALSVLWTFTLVCSVRTTQTRTSDSEREKQARQHGDTADPLEEVDRHLEP